MNSLSLPPPPEGKTGWPWTNESGTGVSTFEKKEEWPRISIVTPSYNQGGYLEETIRSILLQGYPNLEYLVIDGGSSDESVDVIKKYERHLTYWESAKDRGQSDALNRGFKRATGEWVGWVNSDDLYLPNALATLMATAAPNPEVQWV